MSKQELRLQADLERLQRENERLNRQNTELAEQWAKMQQERDAARSKVWLIDQEKDELKAEVERLKAELEFERDELTRIRDKALGVLQRFEDPLDELAPKARPDP